jgi:hypothetical protein
MIISLHGVALVLFITEKCVYCAVRTNSLSFRVIVFRRGHANAETVSRRPLTAESLVRSQVSPCGNCDGQSGTGTGQYHSTDVLDSYSSTCCFYRKANR